MGAATAAVSAMYHVGNVGSTYASVPYIVREEVTGPVVSVTASHRRTVRLNMGNNMVLLKMILIDSRSVLASGQNCTTAEACPKVIAIKAKPPSIT